MSHAVTSPSPARSLRKPRPPEITHAVPPMRRTSRDRLLVVLLAAGVVAVGCSRLTQPDWTLIQPSTAGTGALDAGGAAGEETGGSSTKPVGGEAGETNGGVGGEAGETSGGSAGKAGGAGTSAGGNAGTGGAGGTSSNAGTGGSGGASGSAGMGGSAGTGSAGAPPCTGTPGAVGNALVLFAGPGGASGARGGRAGLDAACEAERVKLNLTQTTTHAFITIAANDFVGQWGGPNQYYQNLPLDRRVVGPTGIQVATSFADLVDGSIEQSLECAKVFPIGTNSWLTGNRTTCDQPVPGGPYVCGQFSAPEDACNGWTFGTYDPIVQARFGSTTLTDNRWLTVATTTAPFLRESCDVATEPILCLAYTP